MDVSDIKKFVFLCIQTLNFVLSFSPAGTTNDPEKGKQEMKMEIDEGTDISLIYSCYLVKAKIKSPTILNYVDNDEVIEKEATSSRIKTEQ